MNKKIGKKNSKKLLKKKKEEEIGKNKKEIRGKNAKMNKNWKLIFTFSNSLIHCATQQMALSPLKAKTLISDVLCNEWWHCLSKALTQPSLAKRTQVAFPAWLLEFPMPASLPRAITLCSAERIPTSLLGWSISRTRG